MMESNRGFTRSLRPPQRRVLLSVLLGKVEADAATLLTLAARLGVTLSSVRKVLEGRAVSDYLRRKITVALYGRGPGPAWKRLTSERVIEIHRLYQEKGTLAKVGEALGISRERVRQILKKGSQIGLFDYKPLRAPRVPKEKLLQDYLHLLQFKAVAKANRLSPARLQNLLVSYGVRREELDAIRIRGYRRRCIEKYEQFSRLLGHPPSTAELQRLKSGGYLASKIKRLWGSFDAFRKERDIPSRLSQSGADSREESVACRVGSGP